MDFRLKVFIAVARNLSFTKAAKELHISQPAISKHIQELEQLYAVQLLERKGSNVAMTHAGEVFLKHAEAIIDSYRMLTLDMNLISGIFSETLNVGASTTIAQYILPELIARFVSRFPDIRFTMFSGNSEQIEQALIEHRIDVGLVEGDGHHSGLHYAHFAKDELVLVTNTQNRCNDEVSIKELQQLPLVLREAGSGTLEVIENALRGHGLDLTRMNILLQLGSTEGIKSFLGSCPSAYAIISIAALTRDLMDNRLRVIEIDGLTIERNLSFVTTHGAKNEIVEKFMRFISDNER